MAHRILVVDDEQNAREGLTTILREDGYDVVEAADGEAGFEKLTQTNPDAVLCDIKMPKMDGLQLLKKARADGFDNLFIMVTAFGSITPGIPLPRMRWQPVQDFCSNMTGRGTAAATVTRTA